MSESLHLVLVRPGTVGEPHTVLRLMECGGAGCWACGRRFPVKTQDEWFRVIELSTGKTPVLVGSDVQY